MGHPTEWKDTLVVRVKKKLALLVTHFGTSGNFGSSKACSLGKPAGNHLYSIADTVRKWKGVAWGVGTLRGSHVTPPPSPPHRKAGMMGRAALTAVHGEEGATEVSVWLGLSDSSKFLTQTRCVLNLGVGVCVLTWGWGWSSGRRVMTASISCLFFLALQWSNNLPRTLIFSKLCLPRTSILICNEALPEQVSF